uniref:Uncharacterized protein n=1 Tax=Seriola dumerili TaxID=41447 RepID=A0A3B4TWW8_SERDU
MEQHFRIALWMFCLVGYLQAKPCYHFNIDDLGFDYLLEDVSCVSYFMIKGMYSTLALFIEGLEQANKKCSDEQKRTTEIKHTLEIPLQKLKSLQHVSINIITV